MFVSAGNGRGKGSYSNRSVNGRGQWLLYETDN